MCFELYRIASDALNVPTNSKESTFVIEYEGIFQFARSPASTFPDEE